MRSHITAVVRSCFAALRQIRSVRRSLPRHALLTLIRALVVSKVDFCCSVLAGTSGHLLSRLQSVLNAAARLIFFDDEIRSHNSTASRAPLVRTAYSLTHSSSSLTHTETCLSVHFEKTWHTIFPKGTITHRLCVLASQFCTDNISSVYSIRSVMQCMQDVSL